MQLLIATLCDSAADYQGKLCVLGAFDTLCAQQFPVEHPQCALALRILFQPRDTGKHHISIELINQEGSRMKIPFPPSLDVGLLNSVPFVTRNLVLNLQRLRFEKPGVYHFDVTLDDDVLISLPLRVARLEEMRTTIGPAG